MSKKSVLDGCNKISRNVSWRDASPACQAGGRLVSTSAQYEFSALTLAAPR